MEPSIIQSSLQNPVPGLISRWIRRFIQPVEPKLSIFLGIKPVEDIGRDTRDALLEYTDPQQAAAFAFSQLPPSKLSQEWCIIVVSKDTAHCFKINGAPMLIPTQPQSWRRLMAHDLVWRYPRIGYTVDSIEEITKKAVEITRPMKHSLYSENGQKFTYRLFEAIRQPNAPPTVSDIVSGLDKIPRPFRTLYFRCQAVVIVSLVALQKRAQVAAEDAIGAPLMMVVQCGILVKDISISCIMLALFILKVYLQLLSVMFSLGYRRDLRKALQGLGNIANDVRRFDGYERPAKDSNKIA